MSNDTDFGEFPVMPEVDLFGVFDAFEVVITVVLQPMILAIGLTSNGAFLLVMGQLPHMHTTINCFLANLAVADTTFLVVSVSQKVVRYVSTPYLKDDAFMGAVGCAFIKFTQDCCVMASMNLISLVSWQRFLAVCRPQSYKMRERMTNASCGQAALAWVAAAVAAIVGVPSSVILTVYSAPHNFTLINPDYPPTIGFCMPVNKAWQYVGSASEMLPFFLAFFFNSVLYWKIIARMRLHARNTALRKPGKKQRQHQVTRMLLITGATFFLCLAPFELNTLTMVIFKEGVPTRVMYAFRMLVYANCAINSFIYTSVNESYRRAFGKVFLGKTFGY